MFEVYILFEINYFFGLDDLLFLLSKFCGFVQFCDINFY